MVADLLPGIRAGGFRLLDDQKKIAPFAVPQKLLQLPRQPVLDAVLLVRNGVEALMKSSEMFIFPAKRLLISSPSTPGNVPGLRPAGFRMQSRGAAGVTSL
jgi:hypothetical protein